MIKIFPNNNLQSPCPNCQNRVKLDDDYLFLGTYFMAKLCCRSCGQNYFQTLPVAHALQYPIYVSEDTGKIINWRDVPNWLADPLESAFKQQNQNNLAVVKKVLRNVTKRVILLNCLDHCYGHVFWKLLNAERHLRQEGFGLILIVPASFTWLVPEGVSEVWAVDGDLKHFKQGIKNLDSFIKGQVKRFDEVYLSQAYVHIDHTRIKIENFIKVAKFDLNAFDKSRPTITFVIREDRFWLRSRFDGFFYQFCIKFKLLSRFKHYFILRQNNLFNKTAIALKKKLPECSIIATGLGNSGKLNKVIQNHRTKAIDLQVEKTWCEIYAQSHIVFGVHGSNMIIPTSLAAGFIEILPDYKIDNIAEDILFSSNTRYTLFLGRHMPSFSKPALIVKHMVSMIKLFPQVKNNMGL